MGTRTTLSRDNWERLVAAVIKREQFRQLCHQDSITTVDSDLSERNLSFSSSSVRSVSSASSPQHPPPTNLSTVISVSSASSPQPPPPRKLMVHDLKIPMCCYGCELKVTKVLSSLLGVKSVTIDREKQKVTVTGFIELSKVLKATKTMGKKAEIWPYIPYNLVAQPFPQTYDEGPSSYLAMFSDDNPNGCSVM